MEPLTVSSWWWTPASFGSCDRCGVPVEGELIAYAASSRSVLCGSCADELGIASECRESRAARRARRERLIAAADLAGTA
jgi:hypothetical protein